jgi:hypothetical protein
MFWIRQIRLQNCTRQCPLINATLKTLQEVDGHQRHRWRDMQQLETRQRRALVRFCQNPKLRRPNDLLLQPPDPGEGEHRRDQPAKHQQQQAVPDDHPIHVPRQKFLLQLSGVNAIKLFSSLLTTTHSLLE